MPDDTEQTTGEGLQPDGPNDAAELEALIAADEAEDKASAERGTRNAEQGRNDRGQFEGAKNGQRAGQRQTPEVVSAAKGRREQTPAGDTETAPGPASEQETAPEKKDDDASTAEAQKRGEEEKDDKRSPYQKSQDRLNKSWKEHNEAKAQLELERKGLEAERKRISEERSRPNAGTRNGEQNGNGEGFSAAQYVAFARKCRERARALEEKGDFEKADEQRGFAEAALEQAEKAGRGRPESGDESGRSATGPTSETDLNRAWATLRADMPEAFVQGSEFNKALVGVIQQHGGLVDSPDGIYRAVMRAGKSVVQKLEREAGRVPGLEKANGELTKQLEGLKAELQRLTSVGGGGGAGHRNLGASRSFDELSTAEQEAQLERELQLP